MTGSIKDKIEKAIDEVNKEQESISQQKGYSPFEFVAHATCVSQDEFKASVPEVYERASSNTEIVPAFSKATQNELNVCKNILSALSKDELIGLRKNMPKFPARVFAIATKQDNKGNNLFDEKGMPIPQDVSYAYSLKKCSACICMVDTDIPLLVGFKEKYVDFEEGKKRGHIYIGKGDTFKPEYDNDGNVTELTSTDNMQVVYHIETSPQDAMQHNVQFVMFNKEEDYEKWAEKVKKREENFETFISSDSYKITSLQEEILNGRATFINATFGGCNPKISSLTKATAERCKQIASNCMVM